MTDTSKILVLCFDGTGDSFDTYNTNVVRLFSALEKKQSNKQLCYYQPGIGTYVSPNVMWSKTITKAFKLVDYMLAWYLDEHIQAGYRFLMNNYQEGDKVLIFGFSRGAYTARCVAGMLDKVGLLPKSNEVQITFAYQCYIDTSSCAGDNAQGFKTTFSRPVEIEFLGVWDTVSSVGMQSRQLPFSGSESIVKRFRQGFSLDEHRVKFKPNPWHIPIPDPTEAKQHPEGYVAERSFDEYSKRATDVKEVWFAGCHTDVGGGSFVNTTEHLLSNITLKWMLNELIAADTGILFSPDALATDPAFEVLSVTSNDPIPKDRSKIKDNSINGPTTGSSTAVQQGLLAGDAQLTQRTTNGGRATDDDGASTIVSVQETSLFDDVTAPMWDALGRVTPYWILEYIPMRHHRQDAQGHWHTEIYVNKGRPRVIEHPDPLFHTSVKLREAEDPQYKPRATYTGTPEYVD